MIANCHPECTHVIKIRITPWMSVFEKVYPLYDNTLCSGKTGILLARFGSAFTLVVPMVPCDSNHYWTVIALRAIREYEPNNDPEGTVVKGAVKDVRDV